MTILGTTVCLKNLHRDIIFAICLVAYKCSKNRDDERRVKGIGGRMREKRACAVRHLPCMWVSVFPAVLPFPPATAKVRPLPGILDHRDFERVNKELGKCDLCGEGRDVSGGF